MKLAVLMNLRVSPCGGLDKYMIQVIPRWLRDSGIDRISIISPEGVTDGLPDLGVDLRLVPRNDHKTGFQEMAKLVEAGGYDVALCVTARKIRLRSCPIVTTVRNIEPVQKPTYQEPMVWRMRRWILRREHAVACRQATRVLAVSNYVKDQVCERFRIGPESVDVVYHGFHPDDLSTPCKPKLSIPDSDFIFSAGSIVPYRGYEDIIRAIAVLRLDSSIELPCTIIAGSGSAYTDWYKLYLRRLAKTLNVEDSIVWAGQLRREEMAWCFKNAKVFIQTSRAESFSNVQVEAIGHGCVCVSCDHPPMPEILEDAALYYPTGDVGALAAKIREAVKMGQERTEARRAIARRRASFFSWDKTADQTVEVLERAIRDHRGN